jgi:hypothetical protein
MNKIKYSFIFLLLLVKPLFGATSYYVSQQAGNNTTNNGISPSTPFKTIDKAISQVVAGDFIYLMGTFTNPSYSTTITTSTPLDDPRFWHGENTIRISNLNGSAGNYITIKAYDSNTLLKGDGGNIFRVQNCSYLRIEGFNMQGEVDNLPLSLANALQFVYVISTTDVADPTPAQLRYRDRDCVSNCTPNAVVDGEVYSNLNPNQVYRPTYYDTRALYLSDVHHIDILNNHLHHMPGGGLRVSDCEDILIQGNEINDCSRRSSGGTHGLVVTKATSTRTTDDYRIRIIANKVHHNYNEQYSWAPDKTIITPHIDEGKGISLQRNQTTYNNNGSINVNWENGRILIANNICYYNGFSGIHSNDGYRIDIINNTCYFNSYTGSITVGGTNPNGGNIGISLQGGTGHKIINNISVIDNNMTRSPISTDITATGALIVKNNIIYGTTGAVLTDPDIVAIQVNTQMANPRFKNPSSNEFDLLSTSPAINQADASYAQTIPELTKDYYGNTRTTPDIGAIEYIQNIPVKLSLKVFFEGAFDATTGKMKDNLRANNYIQSQTSEPYRDLGFTHVGGGGSEMVNSSIFTTTGDNAIVDWVFVELRNAINVLYTRSALVQADGDIVDTDGVSELTFGSAPAGSYFVAIKQRNHLRVKTNSALLIVAGTNTINFTNVSVATTAQKSVSALGSTVYLMYSGDLNQDGVINDTDRTAVWQARNLKGYNKNDCSMDGTVDANDRSTTWNNRSVSAGF